jgi:hypothetical protein
MQQGVNNDQRFPACDVVRVEWSLHQFGVKNRTAILLPTFNDDVCFLVCLCYFFFCSMPTKTKKKKKRERRMRVYFERVCALGLRGPNWWLSAPNSRLSSLALFFQVREQPVVFVLNVRTNLLWTHVQRGRRRKYFDFERQKKAELLFFPRFREGEKGACEFQRFGEENERKGLWDLGGFFFCFFICFWLR